MIYIKNMTSFNFTQLLYLNLSFYQFRLKATYKDKIYWCFLCNVIKILNLTRLDQVCFSNSIPFFLIAQKPLFCFVFSFKELENNYKL